MGIGPYVLRGTPLAPPRHQSLLDAIDGHAAETPQRRALVFPERGTTMSWRELEESSWRAAASLRESGIGGGELAGLLLRNDERFVPNLLGLWRLGAAGVPMPIPGAFADVDAYAEHIRGMIAAAGIECVVRDPSLPSPHREAIERAGSHVVWIDGAVTPGERAPERVPARPSPADLALVQYTSGSSSAPKGVELTHANMTAAFDSFGLATELGPEDAWAVWMPLFHDFALVSTLTALWVGATVWAWQPTQFIRRPGRWLAEFGRNRLTHYSGPNFSFDLMCDSITDEILDGVSLDAWKVAVSGGEQVSAETVRRFTERFEPHGFRAQTMVPGYGMAEATLAITVSPLHTRPRVMTVSRDGLTDRRSAEQVPERAPNARAVVSVGRPAPGIALRVVDGLGEPLGERAAGEIQVAGPSITRGYRGAPDATRDGWLPTGDLGFLDARELFVTGRLKDVVNVHGIKYHPEDLEPVVAAIEGVRRCCVVGEGETNERMAVIAETRAIGEELSRLRAAIRERLVRLLGIAEIQVYLVRPRMVLMTSSGKMRRQLMRRLLEEGGLSDLETEKAGQEVASPVA